LNEVVFAPESQIREICGFDECRAIKQLEFPPSLEVLDGFNCSGQYCDLLHEIVLPPDGRLTVVRGLSKCARVGRLEIPASVREVTAAGFKDFRSVEELVFAEENKIVEMKGFHDCAMTMIVNRPRICTFAGCRSFVLYSVDAMIISRRRVNVAMCKRRPCPRRPRFG
jgi:hypothetical protein